MIRTHIYIRCVGWVWRWLTRAQWAAMPRFAGIVIACGFVPPSAPVPPGVWHPPRVHAPPPVHAPQPPGVMLIPPDVYWPWEPGPGGPSGSLTPSPEIASVGTPEPAGLAVVAVGLLGLAAFRLRSRRVG